jgi:hypothetical protein
MPHHSAPPPPPPPPPPPLKAEWQGGSGIRLSTVDQGELIPTIQELRVRFWTPPPHLKGKMAGGLWNEASAVDLGRWTLVVQIYSLLTLMRMRAPTQSRHLFLTSDGHIDPEILRKDLVCSSGLIITRVRTLDHGAPEILIPGFPIWLIS